MTPKSVLEAGKTERVTMHMGGPFKGQSWRVWPNDPPNSEPLFVGSQDDCRAFMLDRVFRVMLRALAEQYPDFSVRYVASKLAEDADG